jgi:short-subunit dehydrogenase
MRVLITGSSKGLGAALAIEFAKQGHGVILHGRDVARLDAVAEKISNTGIIARLRGNYKVGGELGHLDGAHTTKGLIGMARILDVDILVNNAAMYLNEPIGDMTIEKAEEIMAVNFMAPVLLTRDIFRHFKKKGRGTIININSIAVGQPSEGEMLYSASKSALWGFMKAFQFEALKHNVTIMNFFLGKMDTGFTMAEDKDKLMQPEEVAEYIVSQVKEYKTIRMGECEILRKRY